jgi:hypothetical protein
MSELQMSAGSQRQSINYTLTTILTNMATLKRIYQNQKL